jgi:hypothetical protein
MTTKQQVNKRALAAVATEAEAKDFLFRFLTPVATGDFSLMSLEAGRTFHANLVNVMLCGMVQTAEGRMYLVESAKAGYGPAIDFLRTRLVEHKSRSAIAMPLPLPTEIAAYDQWVTHFGEPRRVGGPVKMGHFLRDLGIALAVKETLRRFPQIKLRGNSMRTRSACSLVAEVLLELRLGMSESAVRKVYEHLEHYLPRADELHFFFDKSSNL